MRTNPEPPIQPPFLAVLFFGLGSHLLSLFIPLARGIFYATMFPEQGEIIMKKYAILAALATVLSGCATTNPYTGEAQTSKAAWGTAIGAATDRKSVV